MKLKHEVRFFAGFDCIKFGCAIGSGKCFPGSGGSHGKHGMTIGFFSKGKLGAVQFKVNLPWYPLRVDPDSIGVRPLQISGETYPTDLGYHSRRPMYEGQTLMTKECDVIGGKCYYDGSGLNANDAMYALLNGGEDALWKFLDGYYESVFCGAGYPVPAEYKMPLR